MAELRVERLRSGLLAPVDFTVAAGELLFLSGPSGAGKSLLLRAVADLDPNDGDVFVDNTPRSGLSAPVWRRRVGLLPAESGWWDETVGAHFPDDIDPGAERIPDADPTLESDPVGEFDPIRFLRWLGFDADVLGWTVSRLSTGERQRLALARLLANGPDVLLLDEATANLDPANRERVERVVGVYRRRRAAAVLWVSHDPEQRARLGDRSLVIRDGQLLAEGTA